MFKLFLADIRQLKKPFLFLLLTIPLLHYLEFSFFDFVLPRISVNTVSKMNEPFVYNSGWSVALMASIVLMLFSEEAGGGLQGRLPTLASLPLSRWQLGILRHLPALTVIVALGLILNFYRFILTFYYGLTKTDIWQLSHTMDLESIFYCLGWAFGNVTNIHGAGYASLPFQIAGWVSMSLLIVGIPLLIDDLWPNIKRSSFSLWLSVSLFAGIALQVAVFALGRYFGLELFPHQGLPPEWMLNFNTSYPTLMSVELTLAILVTGMELWRFQRRSSYV